MSTRWFSHVPGLSRQFFPLLRLPIPPVCTESFCPPSYKSDRFLKATVAAGLSRSLFRILATFLWLWLDVEKCTNLGFQSKVLKAIESLVNAERDEKRNECSAPYLRHSNLIFQGPGRRWDEGSQFASETVKTK